MGEQKQLSFKTRGGEQKSITLGWYDSLFNATCPIDGTQLVKSIGGESQYVACRNCGRTYYAGDYPDTLTQERVNEEYQREIKDANNRLRTLREGFQKEESRLLTTIKELETPFTQSSSQ